MNLLTPVRRVSPLVNYPDGSWNLGESPNGVDIGGAHGQDPLTAAMPTYEPHPQTSGWHPHPQDAQLSRYVGRLKPPGSRGSDGEFPAAFLVVAPPAINTERVVVLIFTHPTSGSVLEANRPYDPHIYPGNPNDLDLASQGPELDLVQRNLANSALPYRLVGVQFVPRTSQRPVLPTMQRLRQVRRAVLHLLQQQYGIPNDKVAFSVTCTSFGGLTAPLAPLFYPTEFHSATGAAYSGAHRSMPSDFDSHVFTVSLLGLDNSANAYNMRDTIDFAMWASVEQTDFASFSFTNRWFKRHIQRPTYFFIGDDDLVSHGTDWAQILTGGTLPSREQPQGAESRMANNGNIFGRNVPVFWTIVAKGGHSEPRACPFWLEGVQPRIRTDDLRLAVELMVQKAYEELIANPVIVDIDNTALGRKILDPALPSLDPNRIPLSHRDSRTFGAGTNQLFLTENSTFKRYGQGTWLGANESLKVKQLVGHDRASVFVGSADGYVTRLMMQALPTGAPVAQPLVEVQRSKKNGQPYALGFGTWGLDVGKIIPGRAAHEAEVAVASYDRVALFDANTLDWITEVNLPNWEYTNPRKLTVADVDGGLEGEIVFRTLHNHLVVMGYSLGNLSILFEHQEAGIIDLAIGPTPTARANNALKRPIYLLSARGHVVRLEIDRGSAQLTNAGVLAGVSPLEYGGLRDLDIVTYQGQQRLGVLAVPHLATNDAMRFFSVTDCDRVGQFGDLMHTPPPPPSPPLMPLEPMSALHASPAGDMEPSFAAVLGHGAERFAISSGGHLSVWGDGIVLGHKDLSTFAPSFSHGCVQAGNIDPDSQGDELVVANTAGKIVWLKLSDLTTSGTMLTGQSFERWNPSHFVTDGGLVHEHRCNMSLGATWAMAGVPAAGTTPGKLHAIDQTKTWWEVDPVTGNPVWKRETTGAGSLVATRAPSLALGSGGALHRQWESLLYAGFIPLLASNPYVPNPFVVAPNPPQWWLPVGDARPFIPYVDNFWLLPIGAGYFDAANNRMWVAHWQRYGGFYDLVQRVTYDLHDPGPATVLDIWGSTQGDRGGQVPPKFPENGSHLAPLRTELGVATPLSYQAIRVAKVLKNRSEPQVIVSAVGGRVTLLNGNDGTILTESADYGFGGMALAVADIYNNGNDGLSEILFAPIYSPIEGSGGSVRCYLHVLTSNAAGTALEAAPGAAPYVVGEAGNIDFHGYGVSGIAIIDHPLVNLNKGIVVTTLNGELVVLAQTNGVIHPLPVWRGVVEGSLGGFGSIVIEDLDPALPTGKPEMYIAGSSGIRRFDFQ